MKRKIRLLSLLLVVALFVQNAAATILPYSSHYQGRSYFSDASATGYVDFAVYDTQRTEGDEWTGAGFAKPGSGRYVYAYQIFSDATSAESIGAFTIMGIDDPPTGQIMAGLETMNTQDPWEFQPFIAGGIEPSGWDFSTTRATWKFWDLAGATLVAGEYSWFLIFSSDKDWVPGKYEMQSAGGIPITGNPEPCTLALLGLGSAILFAKRKNSAIRTVCAVKPRRVHSSN